MKCVSIAKIPLKAFDVDKKRFKALKLLLKTNSEFLRPKEKYHIFQAFRFKHYGAIIKLYDKKNDRRKEFVKNLGEFFFIGETYFYPEPKDSKIFGVIILSRFRNLRDIGVQSAIRCKGQFDKIPDVSWVLFGNPCRRADISKEKEEDLTTFLLDYEDLIIDGYFKEDVKKAIASKKPVTSVDVSNLEPKIVSQLVNKLKRFFFVRYGYCDVDLERSEFFVSRYENLPTIISEYSKNNFGVYDRFSDVAGAFLLDLRKYPPHKVASYCLGLKMHNFIK